MNAEKWRQKVMLTCFAVLILAMGTVFIRLGTAQVLIKRLHQDNVVTRLVFQDDPDIRLRNQAKPEKKMDWAKAYPFAEEEHKSVFSRALASSRALESHVRRGGLKQRLRIGRQSVFGSILCWWRMVVTTRMPSAGKS